jgi:hypothetical protein
MLQGVCGAYVWLSFPFFFWHFHHVCVISLDHTPVKLDILVSGAGTPPARLGCSPGSAAALFVKAQPNAILLKKKETEL